MQRSILLSLQNLMSHLTSFSPSFVQGSSAQKFGPSSWIFGQSTLVPSMASISSHPFLKSAITPSLSGRMVRIFSCVLPCMSCAFMPMAIVFSVVWSMATIDGSSTTMRSCIMMTVLAVPRSIANSCVKNEKSPIFFVFVFLVFQIPKICRLFLFLVVVVSLLRQNYHFISNNTMILPIFS